MNSILKIGHRGAKGYVAENTLASFQKAIDLGVKAMAQSNEMELSELNKFIGESNTLRIQAIGIVINTALARIAANPPANVAYMSQ